MDTWSDSFKGELDSVTSTTTTTDSLHLDEQFHMKHSSTPDGGVSNTELSKRVALLELENERLRMDLENTRIELNARIAANEGLKGKITELYVEMQVVVQQKQKLQNTLTDVTNRLGAAEASAKWYQSQVYGLQASRKTLQLEIDTYQGILHQRQQTIASINSRYKQLNADYMELVQDRQKEKHSLERENSKAHRLNAGIPELSSIGTNGGGGGGGSTNTSADDISTKLESTEDELRGTKAELKTLEKRLLGHEVSKASMENALAKQRVLIEIMEGNMQRCESEKNQTADALRKTQLDIKKLKSENDALQTTLLSSKQEQSQIENATFQLQIQLTEMIARYKLLRSKNAEAETKLSSMQDVIIENGRLKTLSYEANTALIRRLRQEKRKVKSLENKLRNVELKRHTSNTRNQAEVSECLKQTLTRNKDSKGQSKTLVKNSTSESVVDDEGYGDNSITSSIASIDVPSPRSLDPVLVETVTNVLSRSKEFPKPVQEELDHLKLKLNKLKERWCTAYSIQLSY
ncbi:unconventional myosin-XVIIIa-like [Ceratina calcarata]|uniref:Unconventional myosin-XVIIIa-like n=1 Tax=Ceratina calcarata TaxID=156304 RepID=A0AAJ7JF48_9HYME|nr:unconventional myosin-XVIIIa-like [Ceratina calcarata]